MIGPGKYDDLLTAARETASARGALLIVIEGARGSGFSCQIEPQVIPIVAALLRNVAGQIEDHCLRIMADMPKAARESVERAIALQRRDMMNG